jgi:thioredoxin-like negative regulator of GroEL
MKHLLLFFLILIFATSPEVSAQKRKAEKAYASFEAGEYFDAIDLFKDAYSKTKKGDKTQRTEMVFMIAECYRLTNDPKNAETWYKLAVKSASSTGSTIRTGGIIKEKREIPSGNRRIQEI